jgi:DNA-binding SARP family transcriptional activator
MSRRLAWLAVLIAVLGGLPATLWTLGGQPVHWPVRLPPLAQLRDDLGGLPGNADVLVPAVRLIAWAGWLWFAVAFGIEAYACARGRRTRRIRGMARAQELAARALAAATVGVAGAVPMIKVAAPPAAAAPVHPGPARLDAAGRAPARQEPGYRMYTVRSGDTLWEIAARQLGNPLRFREIAALNLGRVMTDGRTFDDTSWIYPGWVLRLPARPGPAPTVPARPASDSTGHHGQAACPPAAAPAVARPAAGIRLPSGAIVGISFAAAVSGTVLAARLRRSRHRVMRPVSAEPAPGEPSLAKPLAVMRQACLDAPAEVRSLPLLVPPGMLICAHAADGSELRLDLANAGGLGVTGEGAADVARAILCGLLGPGIGELPGLRVPGDLAAALAELGTEKVRRARLLEARDAQADQAPPVVLIAAVTGTDSPRLETLLSSGAEHNISGVMLGDWAPGAACRVGSDGLVETSRGNPARGLCGASMFRLAREEALDIVRLIGDAHPPTGADTAEETVIPEPRSAEPPAAERSASIPGRPVHIAVLGPPAVRVHGREIASGLRTDARNLLSLLAVHQDGLSIEAAAGALWPDASPSDTSSRFHTAVNNIRPVLRAAAGAQSAMFIVRAAGRYRLDPSLIDCDLWHFENEIRKAAQAGDNDRASHLRLAAAAYTGPLLDSCSLEWAEPPRESIRRRAADALRQLADLTWNHDPDGALGYLERALAIDEYNEELHQHLMSRQASLGRHDAVRRTYRHLERRLAGIDARPDLSSQALADRLREPDPT